MKRELGLILLTILGLQSCAVDDFSIQLLGVNALTSDCKPSVDLTGSLLSKGTIDVSVADDYSIYLASKNLLYNTNQVNVLTEKDGRVSSTDINIYSVEVEYIDLNGVGLGFDSKKIIPTSATLKAGVTEVVRFSINLFTEEMMDALRANGAFQGISATGTLEGLKSSLPIDVKMSLLGKTLDGKEVKSNEIIFPVEVCTGCRVTFDTVSKKSNGVQYCPFPEVTLDDLLSDSQQNCLTYLGTDDRYVSCGLCQLIVVDESLENMCQPEH